MTNYSPASCALNNATARILMDEAEVESSWNIDNLHMYLTNPNNINFWQGEINLFGDLGVGQVSFIKFKNYYFYLFYIYFLKFFYYYSFIYFYF